MEHYMLCVRISAVFLGIVLLFLLTVFSPSTRSYIPRIEMLKNRIVKETGYPLTENSTETPKTTILSRSGYLSGNPTATPAHQNKTKQQQELPIVIGWTTFFGTEFADMWKGQEAACPKKCNFTSDKSLAGEASAVIFHPRNSFQSFPRVRYPGQVYIFLLQESPYHAGNLAKFGQNFFNWTFTYRMDSDVVMPYGVLEKFSGRKNERKKPDYKNLKMVLERKKLIAWFVSNCHTPSRRENYVTELRKYAKVDTYGLCGNLKCPRHQQGKCLKVLRENYKFYISFENSVCRDYVTEKFFSRYRDLLVPVVLNRQIHENIAPKDSFIAADDFDSPKDLADYLKFLDENPLEYLKYFSWRKEFRIGANVPFCNLCRKLWKSRKPKAETKVYPDIKKFWSLNACTSSYGTQLLDKNWKGIKKLNLTVSDQFSGLLAFLNVSDVERYKQFAQNRSSPGNITILLEFLTNLLP